MIIYISDSINSKRNGGSSISGFEFLQLLRIHYKDVVLLTSDYIGNEELDTVFYNVDLNPVVAVNVIRRKTPILDRSIRSFIRPVYYFIQDLWKKSTVDLNRFYTEGGNNILYVNSWSAINIPKTIKGAEKFLTVCIVRGSPESFIYQSFEADKNVAVQNAANYLENFNRLIYVSENGLKDWTKILNNKIKSFYLPNSIDEVEINRVSAISPEQASRMLSFEDNFFNIVVVGSVQIRKAQDILLKVVKDFLEIKPNLRFHIVGVISKTWGGDKIYNEICQSKYADKFIFHGHSDEAILYMQAADLLIFTSHAEAFPRTVAEYMSLGKPILAADVSGVSEMIKDGENGYLYDSLNPKSLVDAFYKIESMENDKLRLAKNAHDTYWNNFSKKNHITKAIEIFKQIEED